VKEARLADLRFSKPNASKEMTAIDSANEQQSLGNEHRF